MRRFRLFSLPIIILGLGLSSWGGPEAAWAQALPPGQEEEAAGVVAKKPPFYGVGLDISTWDQTGVWTAGGAYRNDVGFLLIPSWNVGKRLIGKGPFKSLAVSARFAFNVPIAGFGDNNFTGDVPAQAGQSPCATGRDPTFNQGLTPRCDYAHGPRRVNYSDLSLIVSNPRIYTIPVVGIHIDPLVSFSLPASAESRLASLVINVLLQIGVGKELWKNRIALGFSFGIGKGFYQYNGGRVAVRDNGTTSIPFVQDTLSLGLSNFYADPGREGLLCRPGEPCNTPSFYLQDTFRVGVNFTEKLGLTVLYRITNTNHRNNDGCFTLFGQPGQICGNGGAFAQPERYWTDNQLLWAALNYEALSWLSVNLSYIVAAPFWQYKKNDPTDPATYNNPTALSGGGSTRTYRQGLWSSDYNDFSSISLGLNVSTDTLVAKLMRKN